MNSYKKLIEIQTKNKSILCVGLDSDIDKLPIHLKTKGIKGLVEFNKNIIDCTKDLCCAYKINFAFYEQFGIDGIAALRKTFEFIPSEIFTIADAKRGDIGNTSTAYAKSIFEIYDADSITVSPYMGKDSILPFLEFTNKLTFLLALTSNPSSLDFQRLESNGKPVYQHVIQKSMEWSEKDNIGYVVGATHPKELEEIRSYCKENVILIPGIGSQGGDISATLKANNNKPAIINVSRAIIYCSSESDYAEKARLEAIKYKNSFSL